MVVGLWKLQLWVHTSIGLWHFLEGSQWKV